MGYRSRERVQLILSHRNADRVPFDAVGLPPETVSELCGELGLGAEERACFLEGDFRYLSFTLQPELAALAPFLEGLPEGSDVTPFGVGMLPLKTADGFHAGHLYHHPLANVDTVAGLERYPFPDVSRAACHRHLDAAVAAAKRDGFTVVGAMSQTILETAYGMRGMERLFTDFTERPPYVRALFEALAERRCFQARRFAEAGVDVLRIGDDIATQSGLIIGPAMYREWIMPYHARVTAAARAVNPRIHVLYHSDGALTPLLPHLIEAGITAVNPCQPEAMPPAAVKARFGGELTLWGCTATQSVYAHGTGDEAVRELRALMRDVAPGGGLVVQFYNVLVTPRVRDNLKRFLEVFYETARTP